jgi:hypothetical protein
MCRSAARSHRTEEAVSIVSSDLFFFDARRFKTAIGDQGAVERDRIDQRNVIAAVGIQTLEGQTVTAARQCNWRRTKRGIAAAARLDRRRYPRSVFNDSHSAPQPIISKFCAIPASSPSQEETITSLLQVTIVLKGTRRYKRSWLLLEPYWAEPHVA